jgi:hypothetical protein
MHIAKAINSTISFFIELAMLVALGIAGYHLGNDKWVQIIFAIALPLIAVVIWGIWAAPKSIRRLPPPSLSILKLTLFSVTGILLFVTAFQLAAIVFTVCSFTNELLRVWLNV